MSTETIKDENHRTVGTIETMSDGNLQAKDQNHRTLGYYDPRQNITKDEDHRTIAYGNVLAALIWNHR